MFFERKREIRVIDALFEQRSRLTREYFSQIYFKCLLLSSYCATADDCIMYFIEMQKCVVNFVICEITEYVRTLNALCKKKKQKKMYRSFSFSERVLTCLDILLIMNCQRTWISVNRVIHLHEIPICKSKRTRWKIRFMRPRVRRE